MKKSKHKHSRKGTPAVLAEPPKRNFFFSTFFFDEGLTVLKEV